MKTATEKLTAVNEGAMSPKEFVRQMRQEFPQHITQFNGFDDSVTILKNRGVIVEAKELKSLEDYSEGQALNIPLEAIERGCRYELNALGHSTIDNCSEEDINTCKAKAIANLEKDLNHYLNLLSGESNNVDKHDKEVEVKRGEGQVDTFNGLKKADLKENTEKVTLKEVLEDAFIKITEKYGKVPGFKNIFVDFMKMHKQDLLDGADPLDEFEQYIIANYDRLDEKEGKDHDGDGDIDSDDYMAAKDKAIKGAMGKEENVNINEVKTAIKSVITNILSEAHTPTLQSFIDREDTDAEVETAAKDLMNVIEQMESEFLKHRDKIAAAYEKVGPYMAPALEKAFARDLNSQRVSFEKIDLPSTPQLTPDQVAQIDQAKAAGDIDEKSTIFTPTKE